MKCSNCGRDVSDSYYPFGWAWVQTDWFEKNQTPNQLEIEHDRPFYLICSNCRDDIFGKMKKYKVVMKEEVVEF